MNIRKGKIEYNQMISDYNKLKISWALCKDTERKHILARRINSMNEKIKGHPVHNL